jgi:phage terminase small subunit
MSKSFDNLNYNERHFVAEYVKGIPRNATEAYLRVYPTASRKSAGVSSSVIMQRPAVIAEIEKRERMLQADLHLEAAEVIREVALIASADPRELVEHLVGACRHCHGAGFKYQRKPQEYRDALAVYLKKNPEDPLGMSFDMLGGIGYRLDTGPNPECPECEGRGLEYTVMKDTSKLSPAAARLYAGVKMTKDGKTIQMRSQDKMAELAGQHLGLFKKTVEMSGKNGAPIPIASVTASLQAASATDAADIYQTLIAGA